MTKNVIQLNGNTYDIRTGELISSNDTHRSYVPPQQKQAKAESTSPKPPKQVKRPATHPTYNPATKQPRKSQTLMRKSVSKPETVQPEQQPASSSVQKRRILDTSRFERANRVNKSEHVQKFSPKPAQPNQQMSHANRAQSAPTQPAARSAAPSTGPPPDDQTQTPRQALEQSALNRAQSHRQPPHQPDTAASPLKRMWQRLLDAPAALRYSAASLLMLGGLASIGYMSLPYLSVQLASSRSEVSASLPNYKPSGFQLSSDVEYSPDHVALKYSSVSDNRSFSINKQKTDWTNESLRTAFVEEKGLYQTVPTEGKTVYIYNETNATWIDDGIWYTVEGASSLTSDQLLRLADSL